MKGEKRLVVTYEPVEFEKWQVDVQDFTKIINRLRRIYRIYPNFNELQPKDANM